MPTINYVSGVNGETTPVEFDTGNPVANTLIERYCREDPVHTTFNLSYAQLFALVWKRIIGHEKKDELIGRLIQELVDGQGMCYTGRFTRLINSICGGYFPDIHIGISINDQLTAKMLAAKRVLVEKDGLSEDDPGFAKRWAELADTYLTEVVDPENEDEVKMKDEWIKSIYNPEEDEEGGHGDEDAGSGGGDGGSDEDTGDTLLTREQLEAARAPVSA